MPSGSFRQVEVKCPFYKHDDGFKKIICEGLVDGGSLIVTFSRKADFLIQFDTYCCGCYDKCEVCRGLMTKYEEE